VELNKDRMERESQDQNFWMRVIRALDGAAAAMELHWFVYLFLIADVYFLVTASSAR